MPKCLSRVRSERLKGRGANFGDLSECLLAYEISSDEMESFKVTSGLPLNGDFWWLDIWGVFEAVDKSLLVVLNYLKLQNRVWMTITGIAGFWTGWSWKWDIICQQKVPFSILFGVHPWSLDYFSFHFVLAWMALATDSSLLNRPSLLWKTTQKVFMNSCPWCYTYGCVEIEWTSQV